VRHALEEPFFVLATQNPIEMEGTYPLPEAQLDRFMFNVVMDYLPEDDEVRVVTQTTRGRPARPSKRFSTAKTCSGFHELVRKCRSPRRWCATPCGWRRRRVRGRPARRGSSTTG
jgi:MoxR-like ATPase